MISAQLLALAENRSAIRDAMAFAQNRSAEIGEENVFDFSIGNPSVAPPPRFHQTLTRLLAQKSPLALHGYANGAGIESVREAIAQGINKTHHTRYSARNLFMAAGASAAIQHAIRGVTRFGAGDEIVVFTPYFPEYAAYIAGAGCQMVLVATQAETFQLDFDLLRQKITRRTRAVLVNSPNNPTGVVYNEQTIRRLAQLLMQKEREYGHDIYIIADEPYRELVFGGAIVPHIPQYYLNTLIAYSYSKSLSVPGERIGYVLVPSAAADAEKLISVFVAISRLIGFNGPSTLIQLAVAGCVGETADFSPYRENRLLLLDALEGAGFDFAPPGGTFYLFPKSLEPDAVAFCHHAAQKYNLILVPGDSFGQPGYFRLAFCQNTDRVRRALPIFAQLAEDYRTL